MTEKCLFLYDNRIDAATLSASSEVGDAVVANLQSFQLAKVTRTSGFTGEYWQAAFAEAESLNLVAVWNHNLSVSATIQIQVGTDAAMLSPGYDETFDAWPSVYGWDDLGWDLDGFDGVLPDLEDTFQDYKKYTICRLGAAASGTFLRVTVNDAGNTDGYIQAGRLLAGQAVQPSRNFSFNWSQQWRDLSARERMEDGGVWFDVRPKYRRQTLPFRFATEADAWGVHNEMARVVGHSRDLLVVPFPGDPGNSYLTAIYGAPVENGLSEIKQRTLNVYEFRLQIEEFIA